jgi:predicted acylesterase/phospholipase RssA
MRTGRALAVLLAAALAAGCAGPVNPRLDASRPTAEYRYATVRPDAAEEELFVILAFSGGGTRAAAFSYGVLEGLRRIVYQPAGGGTRTLLEDVDVISSVSGGSFTAAHYALYGTEGFKRFEETFLYRNIQGALVARALAPWNWARLLRADYSRIDLAADLYHEEVFGHATFGDLVKRAGAPYLLLNATDMTLGARFEFTQDQFDLLCSDLSPVPVARGVAASSAFPVLLSPMTLRNHRGGPCDTYTPPPWLAEALAPSNPPRRRALAQNLVSYRERVADRPFVHLLDGGLADNIGLRGPYVSLSGLDSSWSVLRKINEQKTRQVLVITANAKTGRDPGWDARQSPPGVIDVLGLVTTGPMGNYSFETVQLIDDHFQRLNNDRLSLQACATLAKEQCPAFELPFEADPVRFDAVELAFDKVADARLRDCLEGLATSFHLPAPQVTLLRQVAQQLLLASPKLREAMASIAPAWTPPADVVIEPALIAAACPTP